MASIQKLIANLKENIVSIEETIAYLQTQLPKEAPKEEKPVKKTTKKSADKSAEKVAEKPAEKHVEEPEKPAKAPKKEAVKKDEKPAEKKKLNIPRMTEKIQQILVKTLKTLANMESDDKIVDKFKKYINQDMSAETYESDSLENHITNFVKLIFVKTVPAAPANAVANAAGGFVSPFVGQDPPTFIDPNFPNMTLLQRTVTQKQFDAIDKDLTELGSGNYWSKSEGLWYLIDDDSDVEEVEFGSSTYFVCKSNKRVYKTDEVTDKDIFVGFVGIGEFVNMKI
jgi:hypothetical protein